MAQDARFEDSGDKPLRLKALDVEDLPVIASLIQDAVFPASEMTWDRRTRRFAMLLNRFRWEDRAAAEQRGRAFERVQTVLAIDDVQNVSSQGVTPGDEDTILSLLMIEFEAGKDGTGALILTLSGDGAIRVSVEAIEITLKDVTVPYMAPSGQVPDHPE